MPNASQPTFTEFIASDLHRRITLGEGVPNPLSLAAIADLYRVSLMPVRLAVRDLIDARVLIKGENGRLAINCAANSGRRRKRERPLAAPTAVAAAIRDEIIGLSLSGSDEFLRLAATSARHQIGTSHLTTVLQQLAREGIVSHIARSGWRVRPYAKSDLTAYLDVRVLLETKALEESYDRLEQTRLRQMLAANRPSRTTDLSQIDDGLHSYWIRLSGNRYVVDFFDRHDPFYRTLYNYSATGRGTLREIAERHRDILTALLNDKLSKAKRFLADDIRSLEPILNRGAFVARPATKID